MAPHTPGQTPTPDALDEQTMSLLEKYPTLAKCNQRLEKINTEETTLQADIDKHQARPAVANALREELATLQAEKREIENLLRTMEEKRTETQRAEAEQPPPLPETTPMMRTRFADDAQTLAMLATALKAPETAGDEQDTIARARQLLSELNAGLDSLETATRQKPTIESIVTETRRKPTLRDMIESFYEESLAPHEAEIQLDDLHKLTPSRQERALAHLFIMQESGATTEEAKARFDEFSRSKEYFTLKERWNKETSNGVLSQEEITFSLTMFVKALAQPTKEKRDRFAQVSTQIKLIGRPSDSWPDKMLIYGNHNRPNQYDMEEMLKAKESNAGYIDAFDARLRYGLVNILSTETQANKSLNSLYAYAAWSLWRKIPAGKGFPENIFYHNGSLAVGGMEIDSSGRPKTGVGGISPEDIQKEADIVVQSLLPALNMRMVHGTGNEKRNLATALGNNFLRRNTAIGNLELARPDAADANHIGQIIYLREQKEIQDAAYQLLGPTDDDTSVVAEGTDQPLITRFNTIATEAMEIVGKRDAEKEEIKLAEANIREDSQYGGKTPYGTARVIENDLVTNEQQVATMLRELQRELQEVSGKKGIFSSKKVSSRGRTQQQIEEMMEIISKGGHPGNGFIYEQFTREDAFASKKNIVSRHEKYLKGLFPGWEFNATVTSAELAKKLDEYKAKKDEEIKYHKENIDQYNRDLKLLFEEYERLHREAMVYKNKISTDLGNEELRKRRNKLKGVAVFGWPTPEDLRKKLGDLSTKE